jgi:hypothetical protein
MFIDQTTSGGLALQRSAMFPAMNRQHRPRSAPLEREDFFWGLRSINITSLRDDRAAQGVLTAGDRVQGKNVSIRVNKIRTQASLCIDAASITKQEK